jgi:hypothetical protein
MHGIDGGRTTGPIARTARGTGRRPGCPGRSTAVEAPAAQRSWGPRIPGPTALRVRGPEASGTTTRELLLAA